MTAVIVTAKGSQMLNKIQFGLVIVYVAFSFIYLLAYDAEKNDNNIVLCLPSIAIFLIVSTTSCPEIIFWYTYCFMRILLIEDFLLSCFPRYKW